ncbi:hypothetical protein GOBAR_AA25668 [Gossypium barbadense]|uniref:Uncharacterized protein n=1 Tax=Gossypium barbadense TaxID=3634 RepID=A0A2P5WV90_GOSBA|nr:hypothetical protein GOBAR_AA25668 [Gossypium barbadense]
MKVVAVYLLAVLGGNASPSTDDLKVILGSSVEPKQRGKGDFAPCISFYITEFIIYRSLFTILIFKGVGELNFIIMEAASCSLELCEVSPDS